ncbi:DNA polymerase III subunit delta [Terrihabitans sp. B22-R8]|uniref:DNA polymerase III subunit delta n=1 Tax=Terrihabitans sp. B22-R8 TaxID=3425128 RepID=UPI00403D0E8D
MVAVKAGGVEGFLARPPADIFCVLIYGPDAGLVAERGAMLIKKVAPDLDESFGLVRLDGDELSADASRLLDEAHSISMFGGQRVIRIKAGSRPFHSAVERLLTGPRPDAVIVIEAGELRKGAPLRALCERNAGAAALPCFTDNDAALARLVDMSFAEAGIEIDRDARGALVSALGSDRLATRMEIDKLLLYAHGQTRLTAADIEAVTSDSNAGAIDTVVDAVFAGDAAKLEDGLSRLAGAGTPPSQILGATLRFLLQLHRLRADVEKGSNAAQVLERNWPSLHFSRRASVEAALNRWNIPRLEDALGRASNGVLDGRRHGAFGEIAAKRVLASLASEARRR